MTMQRSRTPKVLCADIFPVRINSITAFQQLVSPTPSQTSPQVIRPSSAATPGKPLRVGLERAHIESLSYNNLRKFIQARGWTAGANPIRISGTGRTRKAMLADIFHKLESGEIIIENDAAEPASMTNGNADSVPLILDQSNRMKIATSSDLSSQLDQADGWEPVSNPTHDMLCRLAARVLQHQSASASFRRSRTVSWSGYKVDLTPVFTFKPVLLGEKPCIAAHLWHKATPPKELHLAALCSEEKVALIIGLQVFAGGSKSSGEIVGIRGRLGDDSLRHQLLEVTKKPAMREAILAAPDDELCFDVRLGFNSEHTFTYIGSQLQPALTIKNNQFLAGLLGSGAGDLTSLLRGSIVAPDERQRIIDSEFSRLKRESPEVMDSLFPLGYTRADAQTTDLEGHFVSFQDPQFIVGGNQQVEAGGRSLWNGLTKHGLYHYATEVGKRVRLCSYVLGSTKAPEKHAQASATLKGIAETLESLGLEVDADDVQLASSVNLALEAAEASGAQAVVFFSGNGSEQWYASAKRECLQRSAPGLLHLASQWIDLSRDQPQRPALQNIALQLCGKLGHTPYVLQTREGSSEQESTNRMFCGLDVCHYPDPQSHGHRTHVCSGLRLQDANGQIAHSWMFQGRIRGESIPPEVWKAVIQKDVCDGKEVVIHRDGRFTDEEKRFLSKHADDVGVTGGVFKLVEVIKYAAGTPRIYEGSTNPPSGSFLRLSDSEGILATSDAIARGTANPLLLRVVQDSSKQVPYLSVDEVAEDVFRLSMLSYANLWRSPRLPITTRAADAAAYLHAVTGVTQIGEATLQSMGCQQYWL